MSEIVETAPAALERSHRPKEYGHFVLTSFRQAFRLLARRRRTTLAVVIALAPILLPLAIAYMSGALELPRGEEVFITLSEKLYLLGIAPLLSLFLACMLIGEDIENNTIHYVLCRPVPRSAWVLGKWLGYWVFATGTIVAALGLVYLSCTTLGDFHVNPSNLRLLAQYSGVLAIAMAVYGALSMFLGAATKRPVVYGILYLYAWQRSAITVPGLIDFMTAEKYLNALLPPLAIQRDNPALQTAIGEYLKEEFTVSAGMALVVLSVATVLFIVLTTVVIRLREFTAARAAGT